MTDYDFSDVIAHVKSLTSIRVRQRHANPFIADITPRWFRYAAYRQAAQAILGRLLQSGPAVLLCDPDTADELSELSDVCSVHASQISAADMPMSATSSATSQKSSDREWQSRNSKLLSVPSGICPVDLWSRLYRGNWILYGPAGSVGECDCERVAVALADSQMERHVQMLTSQVRWFVSAFFDNAALQTGLSQCSQAGRCDL